MFKYLLYKFGQFCVNHIPLKTTYRIAGFLSELQCYLSPRDRRSVRNNLRVILPAGNNIRKLTREVFRNFGKYLVEFFRMEKYLDKEYIQTHVTVRNIHYLDEALKRGTGGILLTAHLGNWELGGVVISMLGYPLIAVALPHKERPVNDLFNHQRETKGITIVPLQKGVRKCIEALNENKIVALLADRDFTLNGEMMDFLGKKALLPKGPAAFSLKTGAPVIPVFVIRETDDHFLVLFGEPIFPPRDQNDAGALSKLMRRYAVVIEEKIRQYPTQWLMFREFWVG